MFEPFRHRNYRLFFTGQTVSFVGTWMQVTALGWLVYRLTHDPFQLGLVGFINQLPVLLLGTWGGAAADRFDRRKLILTTQALAMVQAVILAWLTLSGRVQIWHIYCLTAWMGALNAFDFPTRQVFCGSLVPPSNRHNAIALHSGLVHSTRVLGPAIAGFVVAAWGEGICFLSNAVSFLAILTALAMMRDTAAPPKTEQGGALSRMRQGLAYAWRHEAIHVLLLLVTLIGLAGMPFRVLLPVFAGDILGGGAKTLGLLLGANGIGATLGALTVARRKSTVGLERILARAVFVLGTALACFAFSKVFWLSCLFLSFAGWALIVLLAGSNTMLQELSTDQYRGRVMGYFIMLFMGMAPFGSFVVGSLAARFGAPWAVSMVAGVCICTGIYTFNRMPERIELYRRREMKLSLAPTNVGPV